MTTRSDSGFFAAAITLIMSASAVALVSALLLAMQMSRGEKTTMRAIADRHAAEALLVQSIVELEQSRRRLETWDGAGRRDVFNGHVSALRMLKSNSADGSVCAKALGLERLPASSLLLVAGAGEKLRPLMAVAFLDAPAGPHFVAQRLITTQREISQCAL